MKLIKYLFILFIPLLYSCCNNKVKYDASIRHQLDSINIEFAIAKDSIAYLNNQIELGNQRQQTLIDSLNVCDSINTIIYGELFVSNYKLGRIKSYCDIVAKDNTQLKYLRGWINRVLED